MRSLNWRKEEIDTGKFVQGDRFVPAGHVECVVLMSRIDK